MATREELLQRKAALERRAELQAKEAESESSFIESFLRRGRLGFGNIQGSVDYLQGQGQNATVEDGDISIDGKPLDPNGLRSIADVTPAGFLYNLLKGEGLEEPAQRLQENLKDLPFDIAESPAELLNIGLSTAGGASGAAVGGLTGPGAIAASPALAVTGSAAGAMVAEKIKQAIGEKLGVYKTSDEFLTPETVSSGQLGGLSGVIPGVLQGVKGPIKAGSEALIDAKIPQRIWAQAANMTDELAENPKTIDYLMETLEGGGSKGLRSRALVSGEQQKNLLNDELANASPISFDDVKSALPSHLEKAAEGDLALQKKAVDDILEQHRSFYSENITRDRVDDIGQEFPPDDYLRRIYNKQFPRENVNLEMGPFKATSSIPNKRPSFEEFKASVIENFDQPKSGGDLLERVAVAQKKDAPKFIESDLRKIYEQTYPAEKVVSRTYPAPKGAMKRPSFEEWKADEVAKFTKKNPAERFVTNKEYVANAKTLNERKQALQNASKKLFGDDAYNTSKKSVQKSLSTVLKTKIEEAAKDPNKIRELNQNIHSFYSLAESLKDKEAMELAKPLMSGTDAIVGAMAGPAAVAKKALLNRIPGGVWAGTKGATFLQKMLKKGAKAEVQGMPKTEAAIIAAIRQMVGSQDLQE